MERTRYRTRRLQRLSRSLESQGGIEGYYRKLKIRGYTRAAIAAELCMTPHALAYWVKAWNREEEEPPNE
jgi:hypothetical protein